MSHPEVPLSSLIRPAKTIRAGKLDYPVLSMTMRDGLVDQATKFKKRVASEDTSNYKVIKKNQLVVGFPIDEGVLSFQRLYSEAIVSPAYDVWDVISQEVLTDYLERFLRGPIALTFYAQKLRGSTARRRTLPDDVFLSLSVPLPAITEQTRILAILDQADALRAKRREALAQLDSLTQSIFIEMFGDPVANPKGFPVRTLGEIIKFEGGSQPPASTFSSEDAPDRIRLVQIRDFKSDRFKTFIPRKLSKRFFGEDDVMIGRYGPPVFQILRGLSGSYNVALMKAVPRDGVTKDFVFHLLKEERLHNFVVANSERTAGQSGVNLELLEKYQAYLPPIELQMQFSKQMAQLKTMVKSMNEAQTESDSLFASLQHRAFRGDL